MKNSMDIKNGDGRGSFAKSTWESMKGVVPAPSPGTLSILLEGGDEDIMLSREEVESRISAYFQRKIGICKNENGETMYFWKTPPTKAEFCGVLGISLSTLSRYTKGSYSGGTRYLDMTSQRIPSDCFDLIRKALLVISDFYESLLAQNRNHSGEIFWLLNLQNERWSNQQEITVEAVSQGRIPQLSQDELLGLEALDCDAEMDF